jgi:hypothetical protein
MMEIFGWSTALSGDSTLLQSNDLSDEYSDVHLLEMEKT